MSDFLYYFSNHFLFFILSISLIILVVSTSRISKTKKNQLLLIVLTTIVLALCEFFENFFTNEYIKEENFGRYLFSSSAYILRPILIVFFYHIRLDFKTKKQYFIWIPAIFNTIIYILALFAYKNPAMGFVYHYSENNTFVRGPLGYTVFIVSGLYLALLIILSLGETIIFKQKKQENIIIIYTISMAIIMESLVIGLNLRESYTSEVFIIGAILYYAYLNYDKSASDAIKHEREMQAKTTTLMLSQIQPHFIYNTLATIQVLCDINPTQAAKTIENFTKYLRMNTDALSKKEPVPVVEEVKHAMAYADIEMLRFEQVKVYFIIKDTDFRLPVLTIEPIVENAIKYGVRARENGKVTIMTYFQDNQHFLVIKDNGVGFDINNLNDGKVHVGIDNVRTRIQNMVHGTFKIESIIGEGTTVTITIPEED